MSSVFEIPAQSLCLFVVLLLSAGTDLKHRRIPNAVTIPALLGGILFHAVPWGEGIGCALAGCLTGLLVALVPYLMGGMGGGDLKLIGAAGAWMGPEGVSCLLIYGAMAGGIMALVMIACGAPVNLCRLKEDASALLAGRTSPTAPGAGMPYSLPIAFGFIISQCFGSPL